MVPAQEELIRNKFGVKRIAAKSPQTPETQTKSAQYEKTATGPNGHKIGLKTGKWYDVQSGSEIK